MNRMIFGVVAIVFALVPGTTHAQDLLPTKGWGSLSGKVTLAGTDAVPEMPSLEKRMAEHADKVCCLAGKAFEKKDTLWLIDPKTRAVANVVVWIKAPKGTYLPVHEKLKGKREVVIDQPHCAFVPRISAYNPKVRGDDGKLADSGQTLVLKNSAAVAHNIRATAHPKYNESFNTTLPSKTDITKKFNPQPLPVNLQCDLHPWMAGRLYVFDHPYYAITNEKGEYELPYVPAGAEIIVMAHHEEKGWVLTNEGKAFTVKEGKNKLDFELVK